MFVRPLLLSVGAALLGVSAAAQTSLTPMQLNQRGRWAEAAVLAERMLAPGNTMPLPERCDTRYALAYAYNRTGRPEAAFDQAGRLLEECASLTGHWTLRDGAALHDQLNPNRVTRPTIRSDDGWSVGDPAALGLDTIALAEHRVLCDTTGADACLVAYRGQIVQEWYAPRYAEPVATMSSVKSWTALLAGMLIADGKLALDDPVSKWIPEWKAGAAGGVTVRHLLTMTSGLPKLPPNTPQVGAAGDKNAFVFGQALVTRPGERFAYSNEGAQLLSPILERAAGKPVQDFARERLFGPLRMRDTELRVDSAGHAWTYADARTTLRDFAKICQLVLDGGRWAGTQVVPEDWVREITRPTPQSRGYGMLWWLTTNPIIHATRGANNTDCYAMPELGLAVARIQAAVRPGIPAMFEERAALNPETRRLFRRIVRR